MEHFLEVYYSFLPAKENCVTTRVTVRLASGTLLAQKAASARNAR